jgi:gliding motility-associated-like protein
VRNGLCSDFDVVNILVDSLPTPAIAGVIPPVCETSTSVLLAANQAITGVGQWTSASGIPVFADTNLATSTVTNLQIGSNLLFWTISNGACQGVSSSLLVHVDQLPDSAKAGLDIRSCEGFSQLTLAADSPSVGIGYWTKLSGPLNILDTANAHTALTGAALAPYSSSFSWTTSNGVCPLMVDTVNVLVDAYPSSSFAGINDTICSTNIQLNASPALVGLGQWTSLSGTIQFADSNLATTNANGLSNGSNTLYWTVSNGVCADSVSSVSVFVDVAPSIAFAGADISGCENTSGISLNAIPPSIGSGTWTVLSGSFQLVNSNQANSALQNIGAGNSIFVWSVVNGSCPSSSDTVSVTVSALPSSAVVGANQLLCENASLVNVSAVAPTSGIGSWTVIQGGGTILSPTSATTQVTFNPGVNSYAYTVTNGTCPSSIDTAYVTVDSISAPAFAGNDLAICENTTAVSLNATFVNYGLAQWTSLTPGISIVNPTQNNTAISGVALGINQLVWTSTNGVCPANSDTVEIIVSALPSSATAGTNQNWCDTITQIQLQGNIPQVGSGVWIPVSGSGTISTPSSASTTVSGLQVGSVVFEWVISSGACTASRDSVSITINASPTPSIAGVNQSYCINSNAITLNGNVPTIGTGTWSLLSGNATIDNVSQANSGIQVSDSGNYVFNWTITNGVCQSTSSTEIHIDALPSSANAGADITANTPVVFLNAEIPQIGTGTWLLFQGAGTILDINNPATQVSGLGQGTSILSWTVSNGVCSYSADEITISYLDLAIPNAISPNNDGINDAFVIPGLEYYSNVKFTLFNSWGTIVYESNDYKNDFAGLTESGQRLIDDTYYYVLQISSDLEYKGYLIIKK